MILLLVHGLTVAGFQTGCPVRRYVIATLAMAPVAAWGVRTQLVADGTSAFHTLIDVWG